ncbi:hypothetical protein WG939_01945 [Corynebacterium sp. H130]
MITGSGPWNTKRRLWHDHVLAVCVARPWLVARPGERCGTE